MSIFGLAFKLVVEKFKYLEIRVLLCILEIRTYFEILFAVIHFKPIFHWAFFGRVGAGNAIYFALGTLQLFVSQIKK